ncbi:hypothetical protein ACH5RR_037256 [Cinchona calisaya]|uniref:Retrotransposon gag domain-containing protein n=1 Tax=Cinchona calisaya TaxID=153742 RepID=A0ABD2Y8R3_9GENT
MEPMIDVAENDITWEEFKEIFFYQYFPRALRQKRQNDFYNLRQTGIMTVLQYANKFTSLGRFCSKVFEDEEEKMDRFEQAIVLLRVACLSSILVLDSYGDNKVCWYVGYWSYSISEVGQKASSS